MKVQYKSTKTERIHRIVKKPTVIPFETYESCPEGTLLFGGHINWQQKIVSQFKHIKAINLTQQFKNNIINNNTKMVLINTSYLGHATFQKIQKCLSNKDIKISYIK